MLTKSESKDSDTPCDGAPTSEGNCAKHFTYNISFNPHSNLMRQDYQPYFLEVEKRGVVIYTLAQGHIAPKWKNKDVIVVV